MERFGYTSLKKAYKESAYLLQLLEIESYGDKKDQEEEIEEMKSKLANPGR